jgi:23S rRNA (guanosine2251-2'-O)-methyltransferase
MAGDPHHQGVVARVAGASYAALADILEIPAVRGETPFFLALDQVQDPRNLGAVLRTAEATGVHGVVVPKHHAAGLTSAAAKSAVGAADLVPVARETNLVHALEVLKKEGVWTIGAVPPEGSSPGRPTWLARSAWFWAARERDCGPWSPRVATSW